MDLNKFNYLILHNHLVLGIIALSQDRSRVNTFIQMTELIIGKNHVWKLSLIRRILRV